MLEAVRGLRPGQVSAPLAVGGQWALVQVTTEKHRRQAEEAQAAGCLREAALNPDGPAWRSLARVRLQARDQEGALKALDQALAWAPGEAALYHDKASLLLGLGRRDEALAQFEKALALDPKNPNVLNNLAWTLVRQGKGLERAESLALRATQIEPERASFWETLDMAQQARGRLPQAAASYYQALKLDPELATAKANLQKILLNMDPAGLVQALEQPGPKTAPASVPKRP